MGCHTFYFPIYFHQHATYENRKEKMIDGEYYLAGDPVLVKDRRKKQNLLHRLNVTEYRVLKAREIIKELIPNAELTYILNLLFL
jgi:fermentation-respiration switch protein FrsA (DUF1100 family)